MKIWESSVLGEKQNLNRASIICWECCFENFTEPECLRFDASRPLVFFLYSIEICCMFNKICKSWLCSSTNFYIGLHPCNSHPGQGIGYLYLLRVSLCPVPINDSALPNCSVYPSRLILPVLNVHINGIIQHLLFCLFLFSDSCLNHKLSYADVTGFRVLWPKFSRGYTYPVL